jgi:membrane protease YdiL (CAAX protease family)
MTVSRLRQTLELVFLVLTGVLHITVETFLKSPGESGASVTSPDFIYNILAIIAWCSYIAYRVIQDKRWLHDWGFRTDNFKPAILTGFMFGIPAALVLLIYGIAYRGYSFPITHILIILCIYPLWGLIQQFALQVFANRNLRDLNTPLILRLLLVACLFSFSHFPNYNLMALVFPLGFVTTILYDRYPNLWALGLLHGVLGAAAYFFVLGQDPLMQMLGK